MHFIFLESIERCHIEYLIYWLGGGIGSVNACLPCGIQLLCVCCGFSGINGILIPSKIWKVHRGVEAFSS